MNRLMQLLDGQSNPTFGLNFSGYNDAIVLAAGVAQTYTIPSGAKSLLFSATESFYVAESGTASVPASNVVNGSAPVLNPVLRGVGKLTSISIIAPVACIVTIAAYS